MHTPAITTTATRPPVFEPAAWLDATERELRALIAEEAERRALDIEQQERDEARVEAFCYSGTGHTFVEVERYAGSVVFECPTCTVLVEQATR